MMAAKSTATAVGKGGGNGHGHNHGGRGKGGGSRWTPHPARRGGSNQTHVGIYNERLLLDIIRRQPDAAAVDISRTTGLSAQTVTGIVSRLLAAGLLEKQGRRNGGGIGQPAVPLRLRAAGAYSIGVKIGRAKSEAMLVDFNGAPLEHHFVEHDYPAPAALLPWMRRRINRYQRLLGDAAARVAGVGVATFFGFSGWRELFPLPQKSAAQWEAINLADALGGAGQPAAMLINDATAACVAETELGGGAAADGGGGAARSDNFLYIYIGAFVGGGIVLNRQIFFGSNGNAGALASMPIGRGQLMRHASLHLLRRALEEAGGAADAAAGKIGKSEKAAREVMTRWRRDAAIALAQTICAAIAVLDFDEVVIDGELPAAQIESLIQATNRALTPGRLQGLLKPRLRAGRQGGIACCLGAAWLPLYAKYSPAQAPLLKQLPPVTVQ